MFLQTELAQARSILLRLTQTHAAFQDISRRLIAAQQKNSQEVLAQAYYSVYLCMLNHTQIYVIILKDIWLYIPHQS